MEKHSIITLSETKELYLYQDGVYTQESADNIIDQVIREQYSKTFKEKWEELLTEDLPEHIPVGDDDFVIEVIKFIKVYTNKSRDLIDKGSEHLINLKNGLFNLQTGNLEKHRPDVYSIRQIPVIYDPTAKCPNINKFLVDIEISKQDAKVLLEFAGYSLIPDTKIQKALMLFGDGANGKSIWLKFITNWIGDKNVSGMSLQKLETDKFAVSNLDGKLLNIYPDLKDQAVYYSDMFKTLVGGDRIVGEKSIKIRLVFTIQLG